MAGQLWFAGICDAVLARLQAWYQHYDRGEIHSTRPFLNHDGNIVDVVQKREHRVPWKKMELERLYQILLALRPKSPLVPDVKKLLDNIDRCPLGNGGYRIAPLIYYRDDVKELIDAMVEAKQGKTETVESILEEAKSSGKSLWE